MTKEYFEKMIKREYEIFEKYQEKILELSKEEILERGFEYHSKYHILCSLETYTQIADDRVRKALSKLDDNKNIVDRIYDIWMDRESEEFNVDSMIDYIEDVEGMESF